MGMRGRLHSRMFGWMHRRSNSIPDVLPLGHTVRSHYQTMETNAEAVDFIVNLNDFMGSTAIKRLSSFFQVVFIDCPFRLCWQSTHRQPCVFVESLVPRRGITRPLDSKKGFTPEELPARSPGLTRHPSGHLSRGLRDRLTVGVDLGNRLRTVVRSHARPRRVHGDVRLALHLLGFSWVVVVTASFQTHREGHG